MPRYLIFSIILFLWIFAVGPLVVVQFIGAKVILGILLYVAITAYLMYQTFTNMT